MVNIIMIEKNRKLKISEASPEILKKYMKAVNCKNIRRKEESSRKLRDYIISKVHESIEELYEKDAFLIKNKMYEVTICGRLAMYLQKKFEDFKGFYVDIEYYRLKVPKNQADLLKDRIRCDILLHSRDSYDRRVDNLLAMEVKMEKSPDNGESDMKRLEEFVLPPTPGMHKDAVHSTLVGLFLRLGEKQYGEVQILSDGYRDIKQMK